MLLLVFIISKVSVQLYATSISSIEYLLRHVLKVTTGLGRNFHLRVPELVPTSSRAKSNNFVDWNKLNSDFSERGSLTNFSGWPQVLGGLGQRLEPFRATASPKALTKP